MKSINEPVTKEYLDAKLERFKKEIKIEITEEMREEMYDMRTGIIDQVDTKARGYRDEILTRIDGVMKELETRSH